MKNVKILRNAKLIMTHLFLVFCCVVFAFPFLWMITNSLKTKDEIWAVPPQVLPAVPQWMNYSDVFKDSIFMRYMWNSMYTSILITAITLVTSAMFAYALTNIRFKGKNILFAVIMVTYIVPTAATNIPAYIILSKVKLIDTHFGLILSTCSSIFNIFYFRTMFMQISKDILGAARVDGAGHGTILWRIVAPMSTSSFMTLGILGFIGCYNSYVWPSLILRTKSKYVISIGLQLFFSTDGAYGLKWGTIMASCCVTIFPLLLLFFIGQKWIMNGITSDSGVKA